LRRRTMAWRKGRWRMARASSMWSLQNQPMLGGWPVQPLICILAITSLSSADGLNSTKPPAPCWLRSSSPNLMSQISHIGGRIASLSFIFKCRKALVVLVQQRLLVLHKVSRFWNCTANLVWGILELYGKSGLGNSGSFGA
jgi:hypothetical protein